MHSIASRLLHAVFGIVLLAAVPARADTAYTADFTSATLDPGLTASMWKNGAWSPGVVLPWIVGTGDGFLSLAKTFTLPGNPYPDGPHVQTNFGTAGDFVATVKTDSSYNGAGGAGFFLDISGGYTGISFGTNWLNDAAGQGFASTGFATQATPLLTLEIRRIGSTLTKSYKLDGESEFTVISTLTSSLVDGWAIFDLTNYGNDTAATAVLFNSFTISAVPEPATYVMLIMGLACAGGLAKRRASRSRPF